MAGPRYAQRGGPFMHLKAYAIDGEALRHFHGSQVFDYWTDPAGFHVEHYVDGDLVNEENPTLKYPFGRDTLLQWGPAFPGLRPTPSGPWELSVMPFRGMTGSLEVWSNRIVFRSQRQPSNRA